MKEATRKKWPLISWEPEILISGGLILTLLNIQPSISQIRLFLQPYQIPGTYIFLTLLSSVFGALTIGFIIHLLLRTFWLMYLGAFTSFEHPFDPSKFNFQQVFQRRIANINIEKRTQDLGRWSSMAFSATFFFALISLGYTIMVMLITMVFFLMDIANMSALVILLFSVLLLIDFLSFGKLKETRFSSVLSPLYKFLYFINLSFLYRDMYYLFVQNYRKRTLLLGFMFFMISASTIGFVNVREVLRLPDFLPNGRYTDYSRSMYDDEREAYKIHDASISSYYQDKDVLRLFLNGSLRMEQAIEKQQLKIILNETELIPFARRNYRGKEMEYGYLFFFDISDLEKGKEHLLIIESGIKTDLIEIPFFRN